MSASSSTDKRYRIETLTLEMLVCPLTKTRLSLNSKKTELISAAARVAYPINKGVPLLCLSEARTLSDEELNRLK